jgi:predicted ferric reductase
MTQLTSGERRLFGIGGGATRRRIAPTAWRFVVLVGATVPILLLASIPRAALGGGWRFASLASALAATSLLVAAAALPSRLRILTSYLGVERLLRQHRTLALAGAALVLAHVVFVALHSSRGLRTLALDDAPPRVWAGTAATIALGLLVMSAVTRRRRRPRYEGWRLAHVVLANVVVLGGALHVLWLDDLTRYRGTRIWFLCVAVCVLALGLYRWLWRPLRAHRHLYVVDEVRRDGPSAVTLVLRASGHEGTEFRPGQFAWLKIGESPFVFEEHPFTIASTATTPWRKEFTIKALGDFSEIVAGLRPGRTVHLDGPHGAFTLDGLRSDGFVFIAGGVGVTPMLSMLRTLAARGDRRPVVLVVAGRTADELLHRHENETWAHELDLRVVEVLEEPPRHWDGHAGWLSEKILEAALPQQRSRRHRDYFVCGPGAMVAATTQVLRNWGIKSSRIHTELFDVV